MPLANNPVFCDSQWDDVVSSGGSFSVSEAAATYAGVNLLLGGSLYQWGTNNVTGTKTATWQVPVARPLSWFELYKHNGTLAGTCQFDAGIGTVGVSPLYDSGPISLWATTDMDILQWKSCFRFFPPISATWARMQILDPTNPNGRFIASRAILGLGVQTGFGYSPGSDFATGRDHSPITKTRLGYEAAVSYEPTMNFGKRWFSHTKTEAEKLWRMWMKCGATRDIAAVADPTATTLADLNLGVYRFPEDFSIIFDHRNSVENGKWSAPLDWRAV